MSRFDLKKHVLSYGRTSKETAMDASCLYYAIGDVHGCYDELIELINKCRQHAGRKRAKFILLGDIIDRGPYFFELFELLNNSNDIECIMGNHEYRFFMEAIGVYSCNSLARKINHKKFSMLTDDQRAMVMDTIANMPNAITMYPGEASFDNLVRTFDKYVMTHSPIKSVEYGNTEPSHLTAAEACMRSLPIDIDAMMCNNGNSNGRTMYLHGHQCWHYTHVQHQFKDQEFANNIVINLDAGCVHGEPLTALCLNTLDGLEVMAKKVYHDRSNH